MGIIKALSASVSSTMSDQWREFFTADALGNDILMAQAKARRGAYSSNTKGTADVITDGSVFTVSDGQYAIVIDCGKIIKVCFEPGDYVFESDRSPSVFSRGGIRSILRESWRRFGYGGSAPVGMQRIYYLNALEIVGNEFSCDFLQIRVKNPDTHLDMDAALECAGVYSYRIADPEKIYKYIIGNIVGEYSKKNLASTLEAELIDIAGETASSLCSEGLRPFELAGIVPEFDELVRSRMSEKLMKRCGLEIRSLALSKFTVCADVAAAFKAAEKTAILRDPEMARAAMVDAKTFALKEASQNAASAPTLYAISKINAAPSAWLCPCGKYQKGKFCENCGKKAPASFNPPE